nr:DNA repair protein [Streptococcus merionis]
MLKGKTIKRLKKVEMLEIMSKQAEEIDRLRQRIDELESQLADKQVKLAEVGSIAEASLRLTNIFEEAQTAADIYLENIRRQGER